MTDHSQITEFVGTAIEMIGLVIPESILPAPFMKLGEYRSIGIFGGRVAVGPQVIAVDEAVKAADVELISMEASRTARAELDAVPCSILEPTMYRMQGMR